MNSSYSITELPTVRVRCYWCLSGVFEPFGLMNNVFPCHLPALFSRFLLIFPIIKPPFGGSLSTALGLNTPEYSQGHQPVFTGQEAGKS